jgi:tetratricopeptide (TPR) repeat protein
MAQTPSFGGGFALGYALRYSTAVDAKTRNIGIAIVIVLALAACAFAAFRSSGAPVVQLPASVATSTTSGSGGTATNATSSSSSTTGSGVNVTGVDFGGPTVVPTSQVPQPIPSLDRPVTGTLGDQSLSPDVLASVQSDIASVSSHLNTTPGDEQAWIELGLDRKEAFDYEGARQAWEYAAKLDPNDSVPPADLGDLYGFFLNNPTQGVTDYKTAIALNSSLEGYYESLYQLYYYVLHDTADARATLQEGITAKVSGYQNLQSLLAATPAQ